MKTLWVLEVKPDTMGEPVETCVMTSENIESLKRRGREIAGARGLSIGYWVQGPNKLEQYQMELQDGSMLIIREGENNATS